MAFAVRERGEIAGRVVGIGLGPVQPIRPCLEPVHRVVRVRRRLVLRIRDGQQVAVGIIGKVREALPGIGDFCHAV